MSAVPHLKGEQAVEIAATLREGFEQIWDMAVRLPRERRLPVAAWDFAPPWDGVVAWIGGAWTGNVTILFSAGLNELVTKQMLTEHTSDISRELIQDATRELVNMVAGVLKSRIPGHCALSIPGNFTISTAEQIKDGFTPVATFTYMVGVHLVQVTASELAQSE